MSGTSLDGLDICCCQFTRQKDDNWSYEILAAQAVPYNDSWRSLLRNSIEQKDEDALLLLSKDFGAFMAREVDYFMGKNYLTDIDFVVSHGHTVHHRPEEGITVQIGEGAEMAVDLGLMVINDFRVLDVELGGQGAPLVPMVDKLLFSEYDGCLNLGGIANISFDREGLRLAFDICPANLPLNKLVSENLGELYDKDGSYAASGTVISPLLEQLNQLHFYQTNGPKSLGVEWLEDQFYPLLRKENDWKNILRTIVEHETDQIARICNQNELKRVLVTGGGAFNTFFMERLRSKSHSEFVVPEAELVEFKEALAFAFLGVLRSRNEVNTLASVTGAREDSCGGKIWNPQ